MNLHAAGTLHAKKDKLDLQHNEKLSENWRKIAIFLGDDAFASRLMIGSLNSNTSFYHGNSRTNLFNRVKKKKNEEVNIQDFLQVFQGSGIGVKEGAWDKVLAFMNETPPTEAVNGFEIHELENMYLEYLSEYNIDVASHITRFSEELLKRAPAYEIIKKKETRVYPRDSVHELFSIFVNSKRNWIEAIRGIVQPIRADIFKRKNSFHGSLIDKSQDEYLSPFLLSLLSMLIDGEINTEGKCSQAALTVAGLVTFNARSLKRNRQQNIVHRHHNKERETSTSIYAGLKIYSMVRSRTLVQHFFHLGICISYDRILCITKSVYEQLQSSYKKHGMFIPRILRKGCFVVLVKDNIDKNATANLVSDHFHGTGISLLQHAEYSDQGVYIDASEFFDSSHQSTRLAPLPAEYTTPSKVYTSSQVYYAPLCSYNYEDLSNFSDYDRAKLEEYKWLNQYALYDPTSKPWAQYHIEVKQIEPPLSEDINSLLPLLRDKVNTLDMQVHTMRLNKKTVKVLNPNQTPVDVSDCPVYALTKEAQYRFASEFSNYFPMFGGLHIEQCLLVTHGQLITGSGLKEVLESCSLATIGAGAVVDVNQIKRARYCLQVTLCSLYRKLVDAAKNDDANLDPWQWLKEKSSTNSMCYYLSLVMNLQIEILMFVRSIREGDFSLYVQCLRKLLKWFFALDHIHYARWLTVHVFDLISLPITYPDVHEELLKGFFCFAKTKRPFSRMAFDQVHEQNNKIIKGLGGATNLLNSKNDSALIRWETCGPEIARIVSEFESSMKSQDSSESSRLKHHEDNAQFRANFNKDVGTVYAAIPGNPFELESLSAINNSKQFPPAISVQLRELLDKSEESVIQFINDRLVMQKVPISEKISKNNFSLINTQNDGKESRANFGVPFMNKLRSAIEHRPFKAEEFFKGEIYGVPPCFSVDCTDEMYHGKKSSILERLPSSLPPSVTTTSSKAIIIEASPLFRKLSNVTAQNFDELGAIYYHHICCLAKGFERVDVVFDRYFSCSLKAQTRSGRGAAGTRISSITDNTPFPKDFLDFLANAENKNDLGLFVASKLLSLHREVGDVNVRLNVTHNENVLPVPDHRGESSFQIQSTAEEADQKVVRHTLHCMKTNCEYIEIQSIDSDVLILLLANVAAELCNEDTDSTVYFKLVTANPTWYNVRGLIDILGVDVSKALPFFYALTGCDSVESFNGKGKCSFFDAWMKSDQKDALTKTFINISDMPLSIDAEMPLVEKLVKQVYFGTIRNFETSSLNALRKLQFLSNPSNDFKKIAPSSDALYMHTLRAAHTSGYQWVECRKNVSMPDPSLWGYEWNTICLFLGG